MKYYAHTIDDKAEEEWHLLSDHLKKTADIAAVFARSEEYAKIFRVAGWLHNLGKYQDAFQRYIKEGGKKGSAPHASWGGIPFLAVNGK